MLAVKALALAAPAPIGPFFAIQTKKPMISRTGSSMATRPPMGEAWWRGSESKGILASVRSLTRTVPYSLG